MFLGTPVLFTGGAVVIRAVARSENPGGHIILGGDNVPHPS